MAGIPRDRYLKWAALALLARNDASHLDAVPKSIWRAVAEIMLNLPDWSERSLTANIDLVARITKEAPASADRALEKALRAATDTGTFFTRKLRKAWNPRLTRTALNRIKDGAMPGGAMRDVLASLLMAGRREAKEFAVQMVTLPLAATGADRTIQIACAQALVATGDSSDFEVVWPLVVSEIPVGLEVLGADAPHSEAHQLPLVARLTEDQIADLYLWLSAHRPSLPGERFGFVGPNERLESLERHCLDRLRSAGTEMAVHAIERIRKERPQAEWLRLTLDDAAQALRTSPGVRPTPIEILRMADDHAKRYISSEENLLQAVIESLDGLANELSGDDPLVRFLWNLEPLSPREEVDLSTYVAGHLRRDLGRRGVILNREVNVSHISRTDIRVEAAAQGQTLRAIAVTVEVKGSWHPDLKTAMETQLRDQYLAPGTGKTGLYLVGWFRTDGIESRGPAQTIDEARAAFQKQAAALSTVPYLIRSYVLDCRWREEVPRTNKNRSRAGGRGAATPPRPNRRKSTVK